MAFRDLQFNIGKLTTNVKSQVAKNNPLQNQDTRALNLWLFEERNDLSNMKTTAYHHAETNKAFLEWVKEEQNKYQSNEIYSQDIEEIGSALHSVLEKQVELEKQYTDRYQLYRRAIKSMREKEKEIADLKEKKQSISDRIQHLKRSNPSSKKLDELEKELEELKKTQQDKEEEEDSTDFKRFVLKEAFYLRFNALQEYAEKTAIIAGFGKYLVDLLDVQQRQQQEEQALNSDMIVMDALLTVDGWQSSDQRHTLTIEDELLKCHHGDDAATPLTDKDLIIGKKKNNDIKPTAETTAAEAAGNININTALVEEEEFNEKAANNYYDKLYRHVSTQQKRSKKQQQAICSHRSYAEFQNQFNISAAAPPFTTSNNTTAATTANDDGQDGKEELFKGSKQQGEHDEDELPPPPAYSNENNVITTDEKEKTKT